MTMSYNDYEYFDEDGNPVDPSDLGDDYEVVEEVDTPTAAPAAAPAPAAAAPPTPGGIPKVLIAGLVAIALVIGGGLVWGLSSLGGQNTAADVKAGVASKSSQVRDKVAASSSRMAPQRAELTGCDDASAAEVKGSRDPSVQLTVIDSAPLPQAYATTREQTPTGVMELLQLDAATFGVYAAGDVGGSKWTKVTATIRGDELALDGGQQTTGGDRDMLPAGACDRLVDTEFRVSGAVPEAAKTSDTAAQVILYHGVGPVRDNSPRAVVVFGDAAKADTPVAVALVELRYADEGGDADGE
ncbi:hypothetical protein ABLE94_02565 [Gordonia sp. VNK1]|uniref:hypothetical protein n=1 Tax=Gordonia oleivorans TaxID=3156618 RepID=UPI0032B5E253